MVCEWPSFELLLHTSKVPLDIYIPIQQQQQSLEDRRWFLLTPIHEWCAQRKSSFTVLPIHTHRLPILKRKNIAVLTSDDDAYKNGCCIISLIAKINIFFKKIKYLLLPWMQADSLVIQTSRGHSLWNNFKKTFLNVPARQIKQCILPLQIALFFPDFEAQCVHARLLGLCPSYSIQEIWRPAATYCWKSKS